MRPPVPHVDEARLTAYTLGQLDRSDAETVELHLTECAECRARAEEVSAGAFERTAVGSSPPGTPTRVEGGDGKPPAGSTALQRGATLGRYVLLEKLGSGGMGEVFAAYDPHLDRKIALKLLRGGALSAEEGRARLLREAQAMARLQHPNVIAVHDVGVFGERVFVAMEYVEGETLTNWLRGRREWRQIIEVFIEAGRGLAAAHRAGLVHRDFKPDNVLLDHETRPRVLDFGLARQSSTTPLVSTVGDMAIDGVTGETSLSQPLTRDGAVMGTPGYMAPEQITALATDARSDQFSFCVALWEALFGTRPFAGATLKQHAAEITSQHFVPPPDDTEVPDAIIEVLHRGLSANPADRWPDMDVLLKTIRPRRVRSRRATLFVVALVAFSTFGIGYGVWTRQRLLMCGSDARLKGLWDAPRKAKLKAGFAQTKLSYAAETWTATERALDVWTGEWLAASREVCEAARIRKIDSPEVTAQKTACLDERLSDLVGLVSLFDAADHDVVNSAPSAALQLARPGRCTTAQFVPVVDSPSREADAALRASVAEARTMFIAGKYGPSAETLQRSLDADASPDALAEAHLFLGRVEQRRGETSLARKANLVAAEQALKAGDAPLLARALSRLSSGEGAEEPSAQVDAWGRLAAAAAERAKGDWELEVELLQDDAQVSIRRRRAKAALVDSEKVLLLQREHLGEEHPDIAATLNELGVELTLLDRPQEALERYQQSLSLHEKLEGPDHPNVGNAAHNLAVALLKVGRTDDARAAFERAVSIRQRAMGVRSADTLRSTLALTRLLVSMGDLEAARVRLDALKEAREALSGADSIEMIPLLTLDTEINLAGGFWREALESATAQLAVGKEHSDWRTINAAWLGQAEANVALGSWAEAKKALSEVSRRLANQDLSVDVARFREDEGRLELAQGRAANSVHSFELAVKAREKTDPRSALWLARAYVESGDGVRAEEVMKNVQPVIDDEANPRRVVEAAVLSAQAQWLAHEDQRAMALESLSAMASKTGDAALQKWVADHH